MAYSYEELLNWNLQVGAYPMFYSPDAPSDYHRLQIERWLWDARVRMLSPVIDVGAEFRRSYMGESYVALNSKNYRVAWGEVRPDIFGDLLHLPFSDASIGTLVCTEVLEHIPNIFRAVGEIQRVLKPGGTAYLSSPFVWPTHDTEEYGDYWRITGQGYHFMFNAFDAVTITPTEMRLPARFLWNHLATWECMGSGWQCSAPTGYLVEARK